MRNAIAVVLCLAAASLFAAEPTYLQQNWDDEDRQWFYTTPQGSKLVPYAWARAFERAGSETLWSADLTRFGFLPNRTSSVNPDGWPVGLVRDDDHLGLTCAACHTGQLDYGGVTYQIDGAPTDADLWAFLVTLGDSIKATARSSSDPKFLRFAARVLGDKDNPANRAKLFAELQKFNNYYTTFIQKSTATTQWGRSRTDAFGMIFNRVTSIDLKVPNNSKPPDAPVSYPFLWDTGWHNVVQWNGSAPNSFAIERLARNVGEVLGVFAEIDIRKPTLLHWYYASTAKRLNLLEIEDRLADLRSPKWPAAFPALDRNKVSRGQQIYSQQCLVCHAIATPGRHQTVTLTPLERVKTDPAMTTVASARTAATAVLQGVREYILFGTRFGPTAPAGTITFNAVIGAILSPVSLQAKAAAPPPQPVNDDNDDDRARVREQLHARPETSDENEQQSDHHEQLASELHTALKALGARHDSKTDTGAHLVYKARPLDGIWATAPFLHNGSVPTLYDLLSANRPAIFYVGSRAFDPVKVGFSSSEAPDTFRFDTSIPGNLSSGHMWGTTLTEEDRMALIEYLKSL